MPAFLINEIAMAVISKSPKYASKIPGTIQFAMPLKEETTELIIICKAGNSISNTSGCLPEFR